MTATTRELQIYAEHCTRAGKLALANVADDCGDCFWAAADESTAAHYAALGTAFGRQVAATIRENM